MKIKIVENYDEMSREAAEIISGAIKQNPAAVLGLATGSTPVGTYKELEKKYKNGEISFKDIKTVNLDEYIGLGKDSPHSFSFFMRENLFSRVDIDENNTRIPDGKAENPQKECEKYTEMLEKTPVSVQLLGLGSDGHIGFNEPDTPFDSHTHIAELAQSTVRDNSRLFSSIEEVPERAITMGIADIMKSQKILLIASGANKAQAVYDMVKGEVTEGCPASILQRHGDVTVIIDKQAAKLL